MWRYIASGVVGALIATVAFVAVMFAADLRIEQENIVVPNVLGENPDTARAMIEAEGGSVRVAQSGESRAAGESYQELTGRCAQVERQIPPIPAREDEVEVPHDATVTLFVDYYYASC